MIYVCIREIGIDYATVMAMSTWEIKMWIERHVKFNNLKDELTERKVKEMKESWRR